MNSVLKKLGLLLSVALVPVNAGAQTAGFTQSDLAQAASANDAEALRTSAARQIAARTEILRAVMATNMPGAQRRISRDEMQVLTIALGKPTPTRDIMFSWLMRSGVTTAANGEISGIYSPLADAWLVLRWAQLGGSPRLVDAALVRGTSLRPVDTQPDWRTSRAPFAAAVLQTKLQAVDSFASLPDALPAPRLFRLLGAMRDAERVAVLDRTGEMLGGISAWSRANGASIAAVERMIRKHPDLSLLTLPERVRADLSPMAVITSPQGTLLVLQSPVYPAKTVIASFADAGAAPVLSLIDLAPSPIRSAAR